MQLGKKLLLFGSGKTRQGYTRALLQKRIVETDTALVLQDTIIFKLTSPKYCRIQLYIKLADDSVYYRETTYAVNKLTKSKLNSLKTFQCYKDWFTLDNWAAEVIDGAIRTKTNPILKFKILKSAYSGSRIDITKESLIDMRTMPISLFWLIHSGLTN
jgi:hypothetical protein